MESLIEASRQRQSIQPTYDHCETGDRFPQIVDDVMELDADCLTFNLTRRDEWNARVERGLGDFAARLGEQSDD